MSFTSMGRRDIIKYLFIIFVLSFFLLLAGGPFLWFMVLPAALLFFLLYFFRDPERLTPNDASALISPADGTVTHIEKFTDDNALHCEAWRVSIFLSIFNVHLNRAPFAGTVKDVIYRKGEFLDVRNPNSLERNECNTIVFASQDSRLPFFAVRQVAGLIARRIVCLLKPGDSINVGSRFGMMKFSSRTDLIIPADCNVIWNIKIGDKVEAGRTIIGRLQ